MSGNGHKRGTERREMLMAADLKYLLDVIEKSGRQYDIEKIKSEEYSSVKN